MSQKVMRDLTAPRGASEHRRARRVVVLLIGIAVLSMADLVMTIAHLRTIGMIEVNPIARFVIEHGASSWLLSLYKCATVTICVALLYCARRFRIGECAAWMALGILVMLSITWGEYSRQVDNPETIRLAQAGMYGEEWMSLR